MSHFYLQVQQVDKKCLFQLSWGTGQQITAEIPYPETIISSYQEWQRVYQNFYSTQELRGKVVNVGSIAPPTVDWQAKLVQAEAKLLYEFHQWLRSKELYEIRSTITTSGINKEVNSNSKITATDVFISCNSSELTYLPWEAWEISTQFASAKVRIARQPINVVTSGKKYPHRPGKAKVLAIFGDDRGLNFEKEQQAILSLQKLIEFHFICWNQGKNIDELKREIVETLTAKQGWDILFFAGHGNETNLTGGQISIAPDTTISLSEIEKPLTTAIQNGLQFALFNSCNGLSIARKLIELGLSQVAVMREPIHNRVAEEIFVQFLNAIALYQDVHDALLAACDYLKIEKNLTYPSAYLIPSLFRHPDAELFRLQPFGIQHQIKQWFPTRRESLAFLTLLVLSLLTPVQETVLDWQIGIQAVYRHITQQVPKEVSQPPVLVVRVDEKSLNEGNVKADKFNPIDRSYLAKIIDKLTANNAKIIGIDYLLDRATDEDKALAESLKNSIKKNNTLFIFGAILNEDDNQEQGIHRNVASLNQSLQGYVDKLPGHISLLDKNTNCIQTCPFTYLIALTHSLNQEIILPKFPELQKSNSSNLRTDLIRFISNEEVNQSLTQNLNKLRLLEVTSFSQYLGQAWLYPIIDYSLPPLQVYQVVRARHFVQPNNANINQEKLKQQVVLIGAGGYDEAGLSKFHSDNFPLPMGVAYWRFQNPSGNYSANFTGVEINAYMVQHLLKQHLIIPIPDLWMIGIAAFLGKGTQLLLAKRQYTKRGSIFLLASLIGGTGAYALISMQMYISASLVLPLFLPSAAFWFYVLPNLRKKNDT
ncbi:hypothetical protein WA1_06400 [Scytonema hofmannii PCC 7110]|uniref:CHASE2 domain-containing protein n=1 Tax=Scytonema hofmannii PCC 7110 TaxID=128403 RepID=A0A139WSN9_9CYAN|nr:CHASE2 domain-containing protein [Scytonema hofmannii]KYC35452.1 hypothetical protein WA1_06400 [Scytonema hofmannii PCC 7110]